MFPIYKFGGRWICDGPDGRFHTHTKTEAQQLLAAALDRTFICPECGKDMIRSPKDAGFLVHVDPIELDQRWCDVAVSRLAQEVLAA